EHLTLDVEAVLEDEKISSGPIGDRHGETERQMTTVAQRVDLGQRRCRRAESVRRVEDAATGIALRVESDHGARVGAGLCRNRAGEKRAEGAARERRTDRAHRRASLPRETGKQPRLPGRLLARASAYWLRLPRPQGEWSVAA